MERSITHMFAALHRRVGRLVRGTDRIDVSDKASNYRARFEYAPVGWLITDGAGVIQEANGMAAGLLQSEREALIGVDLNALAPELEWSGLTSLQPGESHHVLTHVRPISGALFPADLSVAIIPDTNGDPIHLQWLIRDASARVRVETLLQQERQTLLLALEKAPYGVLLFGKDEECLYANREFTRITGHSLDDIPTLCAWFEQAYPDEAYRQEVSERWVSDTAQRVSRVFCVTCADGAVKQVEFRPTLLGDERGILVLSDVTQYKKVEQEQKRLLAALARRSAYLQTTAEVSHAASSILDSDELIQRVVNLVRERFGLYYVGLFLVSQSDESNTETGQWAILRAGSGEAGHEMLRTGHRLEIGGASMIGWCIANKEPRVALDVGEEAVRFDNPYLPATRSELALPLISRGQVIGALTAQSVERGAFTHEDIAQLQTMADQLANAIANAQLYEQSQQEIATRSQVEATLRRQTRELALLNQAGRTLSSTLNLDLVLSTLLEEIRNLLGVTAASVWLRDAETDDLVCRQATGSQKEVISGWRLAPGQGLAGWVASTGQNLIVADVQSDPRHFRGVDRKTGLPLRSIITVPLKTKQKVIGVMQVVDTEVKRFTEQDLTLLEPLAATAAIAIENAHLYAQAQQDAETKSMLLREVNHRVKNVLTAIVGLLYAERRHADEKEHASYQSILHDLINRVQGLATVHSLLSTSEWSPLLLDDLAVRIVHSTLQSLPRDQTISVDVEKSSVRVTPEQAHNLALVITELTTNTIKHALRDREQAHIKIDFDVKNGVVALEFRDDGPGYPPEVLRLEQTDVGFDLIQRIVGQNLMGGLTLRNDNGAVAVIQFEIET